MHIKCIKRINTRAPTRIDLAGGTLDFWPLYLFLENPITLNLSIDLFAKATLEQSKAGTSTPYIHLISKDQNKECRFSWQMLKKCSPTPPDSLKLHYQLIRFFFEKKTNGFATQHPFFNTNLTLYTEAASPAGAGLGGSSALGIAICGALALWLEPKIKPTDIRKKGNKWIEITRDIDAITMGTPSGLQDSYASMYGGLQATYWKPQMHRHKTLSPFLLHELEKRLILFYSGKSRLSGINNWSIYKKFIDENKNENEKKKIRLKFEKLSQATHEALEAVKAQNWDCLRKAISAEWVTRKTLSSSITTPEMDAAFKEIQALGPLSVKVCGAGGGGCFFIYLPEPSQVLSNKIIALLKKRKMKHLPFKVTQQGMEVIAS